MRKCKFKSYNELPQNLTISDAAELFGVNEPQAMRLIISENLMSISKVKIIEWVDKKSERSE